MSKKFHCKECKKLQNGLKRRFDIPIYKASLWVVVNSDIAAKRKEMESMFGPAPSGTYNGLCSWEGYNFAVFLDPPSSKSIEVISHEVFHLTNRMLEWVNSPFNEHLHEQGALLHGYLMKLVTDAINDFYERGITE